MKKLKNYLRSKLFKVEIYIGKSDHYKVNNFIKVNGVKYFHFVSNKESDKQKGLDLTITSMQKIDKKILSLYKEKFNILKASIFIIFNKNPVAVPGYFK